MRHRVSINLRVTMHCHLFLVENIDYSHQHSISHTNCKWEKYMNPSGVELMRSFGLKSLLGLMSQRGALTPSLILYLHLPDWQ